MAATLPLVLVLVYHVACTFCSWSSFSQLVSVRTPLQTPFFASNYFKFQENLIPNDIHTIEWIKDVTVISLAETKRLKKEIIKHGVVKIKGQLMTREDQMVLSRRLGELVTIPKAFRGNDVIPGYSNLTPVCNYWQNGTWKGKMYSFGQYWHKDYDYVSFKKGHVLSFLYAEKIEEGMIGGETAFIDGCALTKRMPKEIQEDLKNAMMSVDILDIPDFVSRATEKEIKMFPKVHHKVIFKHPGKDEECVFMIMIVDKVDPGDTQRLSLLYLWDYMQNPSYVMKQRWEEGDIVMWDNFGVFHRAMPLQSIEKKRMLYRTHIRLNIDD